MTIQGLELTVERVSLDDSQWNWVPAAFRNLDLRDEGGRATQSGSALLVRFPDGRSLLVADSASRMTAGRDLKSMFGLTPREVEVAQLLLKRFTNKEIAAELGVTQHTAWRHTEKVIAKSGSGSRRNLANVVRRRIAQMAPAGS